MYAGWPILDYLHWMAAASQENFQHWKILFLYLSFAFVVHRLCLPSASPEPSVLQVYVLKRPHVDEFLQKMGELFECVLFTASLAKVFCLFVCFFFYYEFLSWLGGIFCFLVLL